MEEYLKVNPRLIVHGIPAEMTADEIGKELVAQNFGPDAGEDLKVIYVYPARTNRRYTSCILEVTPALRGALLKSGRIFLRYTACSLADYVRVQCYRCLHFGHLAANCKAGPACGHCAGDHEMRDCTKKNQPPVCRNKCG